MSEHTAENDALSEAARPLVPTVRRAVLRWKESGGDVSEVIAQALVDERREAIAQAWDEGWDDRDGDCSEPYSPHKVNPYRVVPPAEREETR